MTITDDDIRAALDHRLHAAGLDDPTTIPAPTKAELRLVSTTRPPRARRIATIAAALVLVAGAAALVASRRDDTTRTQTETTTTSTAAPTTTTTTTPPTNRIELPPPWPKLDVRPPTQLDLRGDPVDDEEEFVERLHDLDAQTKAEAAKGRMNVIDQLTGEVVNVDEKGYWAQMFEVLDWRREHLGIEDGTSGDQDPVDVFTDGSFRLIYRSDLDCSPDANGHRPSVCFVPIRMEDGRVTGLELQPDGN